MLKIFLFLFSLLLPFLLFSQENEVNPNGYNVFTYPSGQKSSEGTMKDGKPDGFWKTYYPTGILKSEGRRKNFLLDSTWIFYAENGDTTQKINYLRGSKNGYFIIYKSIADSTSKRNYMYSKELLVNDKKQGKAYTYYSNGKVKDFVVYKDSRRHGEGREYDKKGMVLAILQYRNDILIEREAINVTDKDKLKQGLWRDYFSNDAIKTEVSYKDNKLDGYSRVYDETGKLIKSERYINGELVVIKEAERKVKIKNQYFENGDIKETGGFIGDKPVGVHREYSKEGKIVNSKSYTETGTLEAVGIVDEKGFKNGDWKDFFESGQVRATGKYKDNKKDGVWTFYFQTGKVEQTGKYKANKPDGKWTWYYPAGAILREEVFTNGKEDGPLAEYRENGEVITKGEYIEGEKTGVWYYSVGENTEEGSYKNDARDGKWKHYYKGRKIEFEGSYIQGDAHGQHIFYHESGKVKLAAKYNMGKKSDTWIYYDEAGSVLVNITFENDVEVRINGNKLED